MPPKRKAAAKKTPAASKTKKAKVDTEEESAAPEPGTLKDKIAQLKAADQGKSKKRKSDSHFPWSSSAEVHEDYDAMLNQTNIGHNNNKFYIIQVLKTGCEFYAWNRWGRVGETGQSSQKGPFTDAADAVKDFVKKFQDKTKNKWANRDSFTPHPGKYTLLEMAGDEDEEDTPEVTLAGSDPAKPVTVAASTLDKATQSLIKLIFDTDMFKEALQKFDIDVKKMPLGKLSKTQIAKGFEVLEELEEAIKKNKSAKYNELTSKFYTAIPHSFGRLVPPSINTLEGIQAKYDMLAVLGDIELAQSMQKSKKGSASKDTIKVENPLDTNYGLLNCDLEHLDNKSKDYKTLEKYYQATEGCSWRKSKLKEIWSVNRHEEGKGFANNDKLANRKLLWHGTNVAVVTAILKTGMRIMPHSGGRVGRGIYFASEHSKSAGYVSSCHGKGIMFLNEVALGKENRITRDDHTLVKAPAGYDSVLACGRQEPDEKLDASITIGGKKVVVPQGKPKNISAYSSSSFSQSEYLIYRENQCRIRYMLLFDM